MDKRGFLKLLGATAPLIFIPKLIEPIGWGLRRRVHTFGNLYVYPLKFYGIGDPLPHISPEQKFASFNEAMKFSKNGDTIHIIDEIKFSPKSQGRFLDVPIRIESHLGIDGIKVMG